MSGWGYRKIALLIRPKQAAIDEGVPVPVISAALFGRFESRGLAEYADKLLSAMRYEFGGHIEKPCKLLIALWRRAMPWRRSGGSAYG